MIKTYLKFFLFALTPVIVAMLFLLMLGKQSIIFDWNMLGLMLVIAICNVIFLGGFFNPTPPILRQDNKVKNTKSAEKYRREFLGNVSHELKTPIFNIQGYIETLIEGALYDKSVNYKYLKRTSKSVDRLIYIIRDLESISQLESEELSLEFTDWKLKSLIDEILDQFEIKANKKKIKLSHDKKSTNFHVRGDRGKMAQVLSNLVSNSIKYGKRGGVTRISCHQNKEECIVSVKDDGIGIAEKNINRLFERFYRVDKSRARNEGGTGLGLAIVKHIIEAHGHNIQVRSTVSKGSTFYFTLSKV